MSSRPKTSFQLQGDDRQRVGVVALARIQHPGNAADIPQIQLVVLVFGAAGGENHRVPGQRLGKSRCSIPGSWPDRRSPPSPQTFDGTALHRLHHLVCQSQHLMVGEAAHNLTLLQLFGGAQCWAWVIRAEKSFSRRCCRGICLQPDSRRHRWCRAGPCSCLSEGQCSWWSSEWDR